MRGIAGILTTRSDLELAPLLERMCQALLHRGPDDRGTVELALPGGLSSTFALFGAHP